MKSLRRCVLSAGALALATAGGAHEAKAAGFAATNTGGEQGNVVGTNPLALFYNPAGMAFAKGSQLAVYGQLAIRHATWTRPEAKSDIPDPAGAEGANTGMAHLTNVFGGPSIGGTLKVGNLALGAGFMAPFYGPEHWAQNPEFANQPATLPKAGGGTMPNPRANYPLAVGGVQRWFNTEAKLQVLYFMVGAAYRFGPLSIGATGNFISSTVNSTGAFNEAQNGAPNTAAEGRSFLDAHAFNGSFAGGLMLEAVPEQLWIGASYQAQPGLKEQSLHGQISLNTPVLGGLTTDADFRESLPDIYRAGIRWRPGHGPVEFRLFGDLTRWSRMQSQCVVYGRGNPCNIAPDGSEEGSHGYVQKFIPLNWRDTYGGRLGVSWWPTREIELLFGGGYETGASPDSTLSPSSADADSVQGTLGIRYMATESLFLTASYTQIQLFDRNNVGKSTLAVGANGVPVPAPSLSQDAGGQYTSWIGEVTGNIEALF